VQFSQRGREVTEASEGCKLRAYRDTGGVLTIGYGHTGGVREGQVITQAMAEDLLVHDLEYAVGVVNKHALPCSQGQFDALVDFVFNVGPSQFLTSHLFKYHKAGEYEKAAAEFPKWKYDNGKIVRGLVVRRVAERSLYTLQEPQEVHQRTDEPEHSVQSTVGSVPEAPVSNAGQSSPAQPLPTLSVAPASRSTPSALLSRALVLLHKLKASID
jgi:lysozyme